MRGGPITKLPTSQSTLHQLLYTSTIIFYFEIVCVSVGSCHTLNILLAPVLTNKA